MDKYSKIYYKIRDQEEYLRIWKVEAEKELGLKEKAPELYEEKVYEHAKKMIRESEDEIKKLKKELED